MRSTTTKSYTRRDKKSRGGCHLCKQKRIRCDETRPACINCVRKGRVCPGYQVSLSWSTKHEQLNWTTTPQEGRGPVDFERLATTASQAIYCGASHGANATTRRTLATGKINNNDIIVGLERNRQAGVGTETGTTPVSIYPYERQTLPEALMPQANDHPPALTAVGAPGNDGTGLPRQFQCTIDANLQTASLGTDIDWLLQDGHPITTSSPAMSSSTVSCGSDSGRDQFMTLSDPVPGLLDLPTFLVQHWFGSVCCYWSAFDSESNPFRSVAASLWTSSGIVFYSLQSMSAAALEERMPAVKEIASSAPTLALEAISEELTELYTSDSDMLQLPRSLMLGLFCMGSSVCWDDPRKTGALFFRQARRLLRHFELKSERLSMEDRQLLEFFGGCMKYEEMLRDVTGEREEGVRQRASPGGNLPRRPMSKAHAWTGVSPDLLVLFGDAISLCREECTRRKGQTITRESLSQALDAIDQAQALEETLLVEPREIQPDSEQSTDNTRWTHLRDTTECYRIASLLQLYQTFPDLVARRIPKQVGPNGLVPDEVWLMPLALHLTEILQGIPSSSDLRCLQPLLYLSAGSCLRYNENSVSSTYTSHISGDLVGPPDCGAPVLPSYYSSWTELVPSSAANLPMLDERSARSLIMKRLAQLEQVLPPKPIRIAQQLMKATWEVFDNEINVPCKTHWLDIMGSTGLKTLFG